MLHVQPQGSVCPLVQSSSHVFSDEMKPFMGQ